MSTDANFNLESPSFAPLNPIPARFTCEGDDIAPYLMWHGYPQSVRSFALIVDDPDAPDPANPQRTHTHAVLFNIPSDCHELPEGFDPLPEGATFGNNDWNNPAYGGPCPPVGTHRYFFKLYALNDPLDLAPGATKAEVVAAMHGKVLAHAELIGFYEKQGAA
ncbi:MAG: YbhB/YbcL family Raf kinase inhibitor-like protein [Proteobacteria bacterium]|nr:MAG: YbhB/YbcL family Raf kinase inhibitor-like protein [Pseudomonadota bacterium]